MNNQQTSEIISSALRRYFGFYSEPIKVSEPETDLTTPEAGGYTRRLKFPLNLDLRNRTEEVKPIGTIEIVAGFEIAPKYKFNYVAINFTEPEGDHRLTLSSETAQTIRGKLQSGLDILARTGKIDFSKD
ncbi:MAG: hypothetical protein ABH817_00635 [archaeon]